MATPPDWRYPERRRFAGSEVGCLLCPTMIQRTVDATARTGMIAHLETVHGIDDVEQRGRIANDALRNRPRRHHAAEADPD